MTSVLFGYQQCIEGNEYFRWFSLIRMLDRGFIPNVFTPSLQKEKLEGIASVDELNAPLTHCICGVTVF